jgi:hypothetical protein
VQRSIAAEFHLRPFQLVDLRGAQAMAEAIMMSTASRAG